MNLKTGLLLAALTALFAGVGFVVGGQSVMLIAFLVALAMNALSNWNSDKIVLRVQGAHEIDEQSAPETMPLCANSRRGRTCRCQKSTSCKIRSPTLSQPVEVPIVQ
jgi:Zn-dependent protease with chaperone function